MRDMWTRNELIFNKIVLWNLVINILWPFRIFSEVKNYFKKEPLRIIILIKE